MWLTGRNKALKHEIPITMDSFEFEWTDQNPRSNVSNRGLFISFILLCCLLFPVSSVSGVSWILRCTGWYLRKLWRSFLSSTPRAGHTLREAARHLAVVGFLWDNASVQGLNHRRSQRAHTAYRTGAAASQILPSVLSQSHQTGFLKKEQERLVNTAWHPTMCGFAPSSLQKCEFLHTNIQSYKKGALLFYTVNLPV